MNSSSFVSFCLLLATYLSLLPPPQDALFVFSLAPRILPRTHRRSMAMIADSYSTTVLTALAATAAANEDYDKNTADPAADKIRNELTLKEQKIYTLSEELYESTLPFRVVVVGNGAILESTSKLGPIFKIGQSPKSGANIVTFASEDQSFEFHVILAQIASVAFIDKPSPVKEGNTMRLLRLLNGDGGSICSLIVAEESDTANEWYETMTQKYGSGFHFE